MNKKAAVIPSKGIGDALLMMIASHQLLQNGYEVVTFHEKIGELHHYFLGHQFAKKESFDPSSFDLIIAQNDNSPFIVQLLGQARQRVSIFYPTYHAYKHPTLFKLDQVFDPSQTMADNIATHTSILLNTPLSKDNGLRPPETYIHRKFKKRIVIHPTSSLPSKNWSKDKFLKVAKLLKKKGYQVVFVMSAAEKKEWDSSSFEVEAFETLDPLVPFLYESDALIGNDSLLGHLASNLNLPTLVIADNAKLIRLWRPGWHPGAVVTPPHWLPNKMRENWWRRLISAKKVANYFS
jgi:ADP-heptose:LPS heptosyltransferase